MKKFFNEYSKAVVIIFVAVCVGVIACYEVQVFVAIAKGATEPSSTLAGIAFTSGMVVILGYCIKSFKQKDSLNKNGLKIDDAGDVKAIGKPDDKIGF